MAVGCSAAATQALRGIPLDVQNTTGHLGVLATEAALRDGDGWLDALLGQLDGNRRLVAELLATRLPQVRHRSPAAGYLAWLDCRGLPTGGDPADVFLRRGRVALASGPSFGAPGSGHVRLNFGTSPALVAEAVERIVAAI
jgi:cystathionine beta-lyase